MDVVVVGSLNVDLVATVARLPDIGQTVRGDRLDRHAGGKGLNQAVAAARMGASVHLIGAVGDDDGGRWLRAIAEAEGIDTGHVRSAGAPTGTALIEVDPAGQNRIVVIPGANGEVTAEEVEHAFAALARPSVVLVQGEVPVPAIEAAMTAGRARGARTILNPAPAFDPSPALWHSIDVIVPNEHEAHELTGQPTKTADEAIAAARALVARGVDLAIVTRGDRGAVWASSELGSGSAPALAVEAVDTVAAGDAFCGALAARLASGDRVDRALRWATAAGALATTVTGAVPSLPDRARVNAFLTRP